MANFNRNQLSPVRDGLNAAICGLMDARDVSAAALLRAQYALENADREIHQKERELAESHLQWYSEAELAKKIGCGQTTLARLRRAKKIPCSMFGRIVKYSSLDELEIARIVQQKAESGERKIRAA
jgi:hypothetical protein